MTAHQTPRHVKKIALGTLLVATKTKRESRGRAQKARIRNPGQPGEGTQERVQQAGSPNADYAKKES